MRRHKGAALSVTIAVVGMLTWAAIPDRAAAEEGDTERVSVSSTGEEANDLSGGAEVSADGRFVAFGSQASNLVPGDTNDAIDVFVHDRDTGETDRVSVSSDADQGNGDAAFWSVSADGRFVAFSSAASNLVPGDTNDTNDVFVHDRETGETERVSVSSDGEEGDGGSFSLSVSEDGRFVAFASDASNLVEGDTAGARDVFLRDRQTGQTLRVSATAGGLDADGPSGSPRLSADGRFIAFTSSATDLVAGDTNGAGDVFLYDRQNESTVRISVPSGGGGQADDDSGTPSVSADGRVVAYPSRASNLVPDDTNGAVDVFVHHPLTGETVRVSVSSSGEEGNGASAIPAVSNDGRFVAFHTGASNLVEGDINGALDALVHDRQTGETVRVSVSSSGEEGNANSLRPVVSSTGFAFFHSEASNLVEGDGNGVADVFVHQLLSDPAGEEPDPPAPEECEGSFLDTDGHLFEGDIACIADADITRGCDPPANTRFCPDEQVTRGQMAAFLVRGLDLPLSPDQGLVDTAGSVFKGDIDALAEAGITRGCNPPANDRFCPEDPVTRGQMAAFLVRALGLAAAPDQGLTDTEGSVFEAEIDALADVGITRGCNPPVNDRFCPEDLVTRGQMAAFLNRALLQG